MKKQFLAVLAAIALSFGIAGCNASQVAQGAFKVVSTALIFANDELPVLQSTNVVSASESAALGAYLSFVGNLNGQYESCITNAQNTVLKNAGKFLACLNTFSQGLADPKELASLRVLNPKAQAKAQLWIAAVQTGINIAVIDLGGMQSPAPVVGPAPTSAELHDFARQAGIANGF